MRLWPLCMVLPCSATREASALVISTSRTRTSFGKTQPHLPFPFSICATVQPFPLPREVSFLSLSALDTNYAPRAAWVRYFGRWRTQEISLVFFRDRRFVDDYLFCRASAAGTLFHVTSVDGSSEACIHWANCSLL